MAKILFALSGDIYVRNYLRTGVIRALTEFHDVSVIAASNLALRDEVAQTSEFVGFFDFTPEQDSRYHAAFNLLMWRHRKKSRTFLYRWMRNSRWSDVVGSRRFVPTVRAFLSWVFYSLRNPRWILLPVLGSRPVFPFSFSRALQKISTNESLLKLVSSGTWDLIIFPSAAFEPMAVELTKIGRERNVTTLCLIDNWDNLSSKTVFWEHPDHLGVWGEQTKSHAIEIHGFPRERIHLVGTPRFDQYFAGRSQEAPTPHKFPYILFVGAAMPFDEISALRDIENALEAGGEKLSSVKVVYRPHPWQQKRKTNALFEETSFSRTVLDHQIQEAYLAGVKPETTANSFQPNLDYYPALLSNALLVVGPLTTMLLEASLCLRPVVALAYPDGVHFNPVQGYFRHFDGTDAIPGFVVCQEQEELASALSSSLSFPPIGAPESDAVTEFFLHQPALGYTTNLLRLVDRLSSPVRKPTGTASHG